MTWRKLNRRELCATALAVAAAPLARVAERTIDDFFNAFTDEWVRHDPNLATRTRYFSGDEQERLERQSTPLWSRDWQLERIRLAKKGLAELCQFDRARVNDIQRVLADLMESQLDMILREEAFLGAAVRSAPQISGGGTGFPDLSREQCRGQLQSPIPRRFTTRHVPISSTFEPHDEIWAPQHRLPRDCPRPSFSDSLRDGE